MQKQHRISISLSDHEYAAVKNISENYQVSLAWIGRRAIAEFLDRHQDSDTSTILPFREAQEGKK